MFLFVSNHLFGVVDNVAGKINEYSRNQMIGLHCCSEVYVREISANIESIFHSSAISGILSFT